MKTQMDHSIGLPEMGAMNLYRDGDTFNEVGKTATQR
jgi:hypothetical protein